MKCGMRGCWQKDLQPLALIQEADTPASSLFGLRTTPSEMNIQQEQRKRD